MEPALKSDSSQLRSWEQGGLNWTARQDLAEAVNSGRLDEARRRPLRRLPGRLVESVDLPVEGAEGLVLKTWSPGGLRVLRAAAGVHPAQREWRNLLRARRSGLPVPAALGLALGKRGEAVLVTARARGEDLGIVWRDCAKGRLDPRPLADELGRFLRMLHDRGVQHRDLHPGNLLRIHDAPNPFLLLDAGSLRLGRALTRSRRVKSLANLNLFFFLRAPAHLRLRFLRSYAPGSDRAALRRLARAVEAETHAQATRRWQKALARCRGENRIFRRFTSGGWKGYARRGPPAQALESALESVHRGQGRVVKDSRGARSTLFRPPGAEEEAFCKLTRPRSLAEALRRCFLRPRALRSWEISHALGLRLLPTPRALLACRESRLSGRSLFCAEAVEDARTLDRALGAMEEPDRRTLLHRLGTLIRRMHDRGVSHRDLKAPNLLVRPGGDILVCDLDGAAVHRRVNERKRKRDRERLTRSLCRDCDAGPGDLHAFLDGYGLSAREEGR
jgi:tRNA A-37 threonylcarbamoyl transferase component Bud32